MHICPIEIMAMLGFLPFFAILYEQAKERIRWKKKTGKTGQEKQEKLHKSELF